MVELDPATQQLVTVASELLTGEQLASFLAVADATKLAGPNGEIDANTISGHLRTLYGIAEQPQRPHQWGQHSAPGGPPSQPGDTAREALKRRHGVGGTNDEPAGGQGIRPGNTAREALARRHGVKR